MNDEAVQDDPLSDAFKRKALAFFYSDFCTSCLVDFGEEHVDGCAWAVCLLDGGDRDDCVTRHDSDLDHGRDVWDGHIRADREAVNRGWYATLGPRGSRIPVTRMSMVTMKAIEAAYDGIMPDDGRVRASLTWDRETVTWRDPKAPNTAAGH